MDCGDTRMLFEGDVQDLVLRDGEEVVFDFRRTVRQVRMKPDDVYALVEVLYRHADEAVRHRNDLGTEGEGNDA